MRTVRTYNLVFTICDEFGLIACHQKVRFGVRFGRPAVSGTGEEGCVLY